jgi:hypothetical protein
MNFGTVSLAAPHAASSNIRPRGLRTKTHRYQKNQEFGDVVCLNQDISDVHFGSFASGWPRTDDFSTLISRHRYRASACLKCVRTGPHTPFYEKSDATRAARLFRLTYGRRLRCLLKAHSGVGPDAPEHDLVPVMAWRGFVPAHGSRDARYATIARRSCSSRLATTWAINGLHSPVRAPCWKS